MGKCTDCKKSFEDIRNCKRCKKSFCWDCCKEYKPNEGDMSLAHFFGFYCDNCVEPARKENVRSAIIVWTIGPICLAIFGMSWALIRVTYKIPLEYTLFGVMISGLILCFSPIWGGMLKQRIWGSDYNCIGCERTIKVYSDKAVLKHMSDCNKERRGITA